MAASAVPSGLSTYDALNRLHDEIETALNNYKDQNKDRQLKQWLHDAFHYKSPYTTFNIVSAILLLFTIIILNLPIAINYDINYELLISSIILLIILMINIILVGIENRLRHNEMPKRVQAILATLKLAIKNVKWSPENYPHLCTPFSPCVTLQWVYRDGVLVNLPWALLVKDDIIVIRPGQLSPGLCEALDKKADCLILRQREIYGPTLPYANEIFSIPKSKKPLKNQLYILRETPYLNNLNIALERALNRPISQFDNDRYFLFDKCVSFYLYFTLYCLSIFINFLKFSYLSMEESQETIDSNYWIQLFLLDPILITLPLLPIIFPIFWIGFNILGLFFNNTSKIPLKIESDHFTEPESLSEADIDFKYRWSEVWDIFINIVTGKELMMTRSANILHVFAQLSALCVIDKKGILSWPNPTAEKIFFLKNNENVSQSSSINTLNHENNENENEESILVDDETTIYSNKTTATTTTMKLKKNKSFNRDRSASKHHNRYSDNMINESVAEVLDLTHNQNVPFKLEFDDHDWNQHLSSLKPIGLAILLNTCNMDTQESYSRFCSHITCEAMYNENLVPVANRRCLCELSKQIGFVEPTAKNIFTLEEQISTFRHLQSDMVRKDKLAKALHLTTKLKFPFPHMVAVIVKECNIESYQLFSQGTADIILDSCIDYWNGYDLQPLTSADRKKITDFYSRTSLTSYCTAFGYRPIYNNHSCALIDNKLSQLYFELPSNSKLHHTSLQLQNYHISRAPYIGHLPTQHHHLINKHLINDEYNDDQYYYGAGASHLKGILNHFHSTDSLLYGNNNNMDNLNIFNTSDTETNSKNQNSRITNIEGCIQMQCNQVFLGMVTMQYQAQSDMVQLIERLERACIRFVHFSKENELRSRVFSEKMGLESGWNCHISLLSDKSHLSECWANNGTARVWSPSLFPQKIVNRRQKEHSSNDEETQCLLTFSTNLERTKTISISAPSAINLDCTVVKFDEDTILESGGGGAGDNPTTPLNANDKLLSDVQDESEDDSVMVQSVDLSSHQDGWPSLSCLTDSTEQSAPVNFDMSNRAKLPRGIENIRPHLESIDNVPLLVSLFTDCTPNVTTEMLRIMQDYGQSVCVLGSAANADNIDVFMQANISIAVEPLYPQVCQQLPVFIPVNPVHGPSPINLNRSLNALPCALTFRREDPVSLFHLILESRHYMLTFWNCIQFWICAMVTITFLQLIIIVLFLPSLLSIHQVLWLICIIVPILSISFIGNNKDPNVMQRPAQKLQSGFSYDLSINFVHRDHLTWKRNPLKNRLWCFIYTTINIYLLHDVISVLPFISLPWHIIVFICLSPFCTFIIAEIIKWQEIQINLRYLRRARLEFGTKLGMNSPF
ncbi:transmembrane protein 94 [Chrysoperla carnea]|uniref:transmembrane protein 94 n=1 Tax=Chrysoperla carnea TaxID=189513 RepID=UPI001D07AEE0|nr:transmembrane protein 94 [Chrysoperla carnea]